MMMGLFLSLTVAVIRRLYNFRTGTLACSHSCSNLSRSDLEYTLHHTCPLHHHFSCMLHELLYSAPTNHAIVCVLCVVFHMHLDLVHTYHMFHTSCTHIPHACSTCTSCTHTTYNIYCCRLLQDYYILNYYSTIM